MQSSNKPTRDTYMLHITTFGVCETGQTAYHEYIMYTL